MEKKPMHEISGEDATILSFIGQYGITLLKRPWWKRRILSKVTDERAKHIGQAILDLYAHRTVEDASIREAALSILAWVFTNYLDWRKNGLHAMDALLRRDDEPSRRLRNILQKYRKLEALKKKHHCSA